MAILTDIAIRQAKPDSKQYTMRDGSGLFLMVHPNGSKYWHFRFRWNGKPALISFGTYPQIDLKRARLYREESRHLLTQGIDPRENKKLQKAQNTTNNDAQKFSGFAQEWLEFKKKKLAANGTISRKSTVKQLEDYLRKDILPVLGDMPINEIKRSDVLIIQRNIEARGALHIASKCRRWLNEIFRAAVAHGIIETNPAADLDIVALPEPPEKHHPYLKMDELPAFLRVLEEYPGDPQTKLGIKLLLLTGVRTIELRKAQPQQFDLEAGLWNIPAENVKQLQKTVRTHSNEVPPYIVPLSRQAKEIVEHLLSIFYPWQKYLLLHRSKPEQMISENTLNYGIQKRLGYEGKLTGHGIRGTISTALNELGYPKQWIEAQLSHSDPNPVSGAYNHAQYIEQRREMMQEWADMLDQWTT